MGNFRKVYIKLQVLPFNLCLQYFTMTNLRKRTIFEPSTNISPSCKSFTKPLRLRSQMLDYQMPEPYIQETQKLIKPQISSNIILHERNHNKLKSFQFEEFEKIFAQNKLTLDFDENTRNTELPDISTFKKTKKLLVSPPAFEQYKEVNKVEGRFRSVLSQAQQEFNIKMMKINIAKKSQIILRNIFFYGRGLNQSHSENDIKSILSKSRKNGLSQSVGAARKLRNNMKSLRKISYGLGQKGIQNIDKWKLKDFYDPILQELQSDELNLKRLRQRQTILYKLKKIEAECSEMENNTQTAESIEVFAKYSQKISDKLIKKQKKIDKIYFSRY